MQYPITTSGLTFIVGSEPRMKTKFGTDEPLVTKDGETMHMVDLAVMDGKFMDQLTVNIAGKPDFPIGTPVTLSELRISPWERNGKNGVSFSAAKIEPVAKLTAKAS